MSKQYERTYGDLYNGDLDVKDIAALIRKDIKAAVKMGILPDEKFGVRISRFSGGCSIDVQVKTWALGAHRVEVEVEAPWGTRTEQHLTPVAKSTLDTLNSIMGAYNHDGSDTMTDYFDVKFYGHANFNIPGSW